MNNEEYRKFIEGILKEQIVINKRDDIERSKDNKIENTYTEKLKCLMLYIINALNSPILNDVKKAQRILVKFERNPIALLNGDLYEKELAKCRYYNIDDLLSFKVRYFNDTKLDLNFLYRAIQAIQVFEKFIESSNDEIIIHNKKKCYEEFQNFLLFEIAGKKELKATFLDACDKKIPMSKARRHIQDFLKSNNCLTYWKYTMPEHNTRLLEVYMNVLESIDVDKLQHPEEEGKLLTENIRSFGLSDLTLPGLVFLFIMGEKDEGLHNYIGKGYGKTFNINSWKKDDYMLRFSSTSWLYNIFYLKYFVYFNLLNVYREKKKLVRAAQKHFEKLLGGMKDAINGIDKKNIIIHYPQIKDIYEANEKALKWIESEEMLRVYSSHIEEYKKCILKENAKVVFPKLVKDKNVTRDSIVRMKVNMCAFSLLGVSEDLIKWKNDSTDIDFQRKKKLIVEYLNSLDKDEFEDKKEKIKPLLDKIYNIIQD